jgi:hypothetical protein
MKNLSESKRGSNQAKILGTLHEDLSMFVLLAETPERINR